MRNKQLKAKRNLTYYHSRRQEFIDLLGGKCVNCGSTTNLQFDHINPSDKSFSISRNLTKDRNVILQELQKCQLLCEICHQIKTIIYDDRSLQKVTNRQVFEIHVLYSTGQFTQKELAIRYGVHQTHISDIVLGIKR